MTARPLTEPVTGPAPYRWRWPALFTLVLALAMDMFDSIATTIAGPAIRADLGGGPAQLQWISAAYTLVFAVGLISGGRLGDIYGRRRMLRIGVHGFVLSSLACGLAMTPGMLVGSRAVQGACAAIMVPQQFGLIKSMFRRDEMSKAFGVLGPVIGITTTSAPILAGALVGADLFGWGWRTVFLINVPIGVVLLAGIHRWVPEARSPRALRPDPAGMVLVAVGALLLIGPLVQGPEHGWPLWAFGSLAAAGPVLFLFARHQVRKARAGGSPLVVPELFHDRGYTAGLVLSLVFYTGLTGTMLVLGLHLQLHEGFSPLAAGAVLVPWALGASIGSTWSGMRLSARYGRRLLHTGLLLMIAGMSGLAVTGSFTLRSTALPLAVAGLGMGLLLAPFLERVLWGVGPENVGAASGLLNADQQLANALGVALLGSVFFAAGLPVVLWIETGLLVASFLLAFLLPAGSSTGPAGTSRPAAPGAA